MLTAKEAEVFSKLEAEGATHLDNYKISLSYPLIALTLGNQSNYMNVAAAEQLVVDIQAAVAKIQAIARKAAS